MADQIRLHNATAQPVLLMIEPYPDQYEMGPGETVDLKGTFATAKGVIEIQLYDTCISLESSVDAIVTKNNVVQRPR